jgi:hypothetical protein
MAAISRENNPPVRPETTPISAALIQALHPAEPDMSPK